MLYIATRVGVFGYNINTGQWRKLPSFAKNNTQDNFNVIEASKSYALYICEQNNLYIGTNYGVFSVNINNMDKYIQEDSSLLSYKQILREVSVWQFLPEDNQLYIASNKGLHRVDVNTQQATFLFGFSNYFDNISNNTVKSLALDNSGVFWLGSKTSGVYLWDPSRELISNYRYQKNAENSLSHNAVWALQHHSDDEQKFWVRTSQGLNLVDKAKGIVERLMLTDSTKSQFSENHIFNIFNYGENSLLLSTLKGTLLYNTDLKQVTDMKFSDEAADILAKDHYFVHMQDQRYLWLVYEENVALVDLKTGKGDPLSSIAAIVPLNKIYHFLSLLPNSQTM